MAEWIAAVIVAAVVAAAHYLWQGGSSPSTRGLLAALRALAVAGVVALLLDAPVGRARPIRPAVFLDHSLSMTRGGAAVAAAALDTVRALAADTTWAFGDSVRVAAESPLPADGDTRVRELVARSLAAGRPAIVVTDGELAGANGLDGLMAGSRVIVLPRPPFRDAAILSMEVPRAAVAGDSITVTFTLAAGAGGAGDGVLGVRLGSASAGEWPFGAMSPWSERQMEIRVRAAQPAGPAILHAGIRSEDDAEPRNDTLAATVELSRAPSAVFVSTSPDQDSRYALAVLRGALALPVRGFLRVAPGAWRHEGSLTPAAEREVRDALLDAPVAILHGDSSIFGPPLAATFGSLALWSPATGDDGEWYAVASPPSPLSAALASLPLDSLAPVWVGAPARGDWVALEARRGREAARRPVITGRDSPRRIVHLTASGFWRWRFRGSSGADSHAALIGGIVDWLAAERADRRAAVPDENVLRSGQPVRWRRGTAADSVVRVALAGIGRTDTITLRFGSAAVQESPSLPPGVYRSTVAGGTSLLVVNQSSELLPARPQLQSRTLGEGAAAGAGRGARSLPWLYALVIVLLCSEWILRRRAGLR